MANATRQIASSPPLAPIGDPYFYGWRMVPQWNDDGSQNWEKVPLTAWDVLHPEEDDFIVQSDAHDDDCHYLKGALEEVLAGRPNVDVFADLRIDWQVPRLSVHGPDIVVFEGLKSPWVRERGTFPVKDMGARPLLVIEVVSPNTRDIDTVSKVIEYHRVGVPIYIQVHRDDSGETPVVSAEGYRTEPGGYARIPDDPRGVWVESVRVWIRGNGDRVACFNERGERILERNELRQHLDLEKQRADIEQAARLAAEQKMKELEAEVKRLRGDTT